MGIATQEKWPYCQGPQASVLLLYSPIHRPAPPAAACEAVLDEFHQAPLLYCLHPRSAAAPLLPEAGRPACAPGAGEGSTARGVGPGARRAGRCGKADPSSSLTTPSVSIHARRYAHQHPGEKSSVKHRHCGFLPKASAQRPNHQPQTRGKKKRKQKKPKPHTAEGAGLPPAFSCSHSPQRLLQQPQMPQPADGSSSRNGVCAASHPTVPLGGSSLRVALPRPTPLCHADPRRSRRLPADAKSQQSLTSPRCLTAETCRGRLQSHRHRYELPVRSGQEVTASGASHRPETRCSLAGRTRQTSSELSCQREQGGRRDNQLYRTILWASKKTFIRRAVTSLSPSTQTCVRRFPPFAAEWLVTDSLCAGAGQDGVRPSVPPSHQSSRVASPQPRTVVLHQQGQAKRAPTCTGGGHLPSSLPSSARLCKPCAVIAM